MAGIDFEQFVARIDAAATDLGGDRHVRTAIANVFDRSLREAIASRLGLLHPFDLPAVAAWTLARNDDFAMAMQMVEIYHAANDRREVVVRPWRGAGFEILPKQIRIVGHEWAFDAIIAYPDRDGDGWSVALTDFGKEAISGHRYIVALGKSITKVKTPEATRGAMLRMAWKSFGIDLSQAA